MDNQHRQIKGYRELTQTEIDLMNRIKALGPEIDSVIKDVRLHLSQQALAAHVESSAVDDALRHQGQAEADRLSKAEPQRWAAEGKTDLQKGLMSLTRAIAQPTFF